MDRFVPRAGMVVRGAMCRDDSRLATATATLLLSWRAKRGHPWCSIGEAKLKLHS